jgi:hypothetical protein
MVFPVGAGTPTTHYLADGVWYPSSVQGKRGCCVCDELSSELVEVGRLQI